ncbi:bZIP transcription factor [Fibrisoma montanum]|uniref:BZIP transcription factor n=1 Tax=Fibrisoma montanum TaxID=2305895 RepID=A0A418MK67_9BACT|nr:bZIP transcription factor [Fibrisoma montanum]
MAGVNAKGSSSTFVGDLAGQENLADFNTFVGASAGQSNTQGAGNTFVGYRTGQLNAFGNQNTFIGQEAGLLSVASANTFVGFRAGNRTSSGGFNTFIGVQAGQNNTSGSSNFIMGTNAGLANTTGSANFFLGDNAGGGNTGGSFNVYLGANAGNGTGVNGDNNLAIGFEAGRANVAGINNTFLGFRADAGAGGLSNATAIGNNARVNISNAVVLGDNANVGVGTSAPATRLHVVSGVANQSGLRLGNLTSASPASLTSQTKFLSVDAQGNVILASSNTSARQPANESLWLLDGQQLRNTAGQTLVLGRPGSAVPSGYRLIVEEGILTEKLKVAIKNTNEWSDYVFAPTYQLKPLSEVEQYVKVNKHLPGVPSAEEVVKAGLDVAKMNAKLLEKIEELTLYIIDLKRENQHQSNRLQRLEQNTK